jgi:hypothetical protein
MDVLFNANFPFPIALAPYRIAKRHERKPRLQKWLGLSVVK